MSTLKVNKIVGLTSPLVVVPGQAMHVISITVANSPYTADEEDGLIVVDTAGGAVSMTLPDPTLLPGAWMIIKDGSGNCSPTDSITVNAPSGTTVDKQQSLSLTASFEALNVISNGVEWFAF